MNNSFSTTVATKNWGLIFCSFLFSLAALSVVANRIDFHPDEAIYLSKILPSLDNDSGLFFNAWYLGTTFGNPTPNLARFSCALLGALAIASVTIVFVRCFPEKRRMIAILVSLILLVSYQGVFLIVRLRPEISWVALTAIVLAGLTILQSSPTTPLRVLTLAMLVLLPMNHRLAWIACFYIGGYLILFGRGRYGMSFTIAALIAMPLGVLVQLGIRPWLVGEGYAIAFGKFIAPSGVGTRLPPIAFLQNVFFECSSAFNDTSANRSWWNHMPRTGALNHHAVANWMWGIGCIQPMLAKTWQLRYILFAPYFFLALMYVAGYFNPTYFAIFSVFTLLGFAFLAVEFKSKTSVRWMASACVLISVFNGASFLTTRVFNHGRASYFDVETSLRKFVSGLPPESSIAVSERMQSIAFRHPGPRFVLYKDVVPDDIDFIVADEYDFEIYTRFISDYVEKQRKIELAINNYKMVGARTFPVYWRDRLLVSTAPSRYSLIQGSWFFRNSVQYRIMILQRPEMEFLLQPPSIFNASATQ